MKKIILKGEPRSTNMLYRSVCRGSFPSVYMSKQGKDLKESYGWQAKSQWKGKPLETDVEIYVKLFLGTKRKCDIDNFNKILYDSLSGVIWLDDSQIIKVTTEKGYCKEDPRIELEVIHS